MQAACRHTYTAGVHNLQSAIFAATLKNILKDLLWLYFQCMHVAVTQILISCINIRIVYALA